LCHCFGAGGSADLAVSNLTLVKKYGDFQKGHVSAFVRFHARVCEDDVNHTHNI